MKIILEHKFLLTSIFIGLLVYYYAFWTYNKYLKNKKSIKNIDSNKQNIKNFDIFDKNIDSVPLVIKKDMKPIANQTDVNWQNVLKDINHQSDMLQSNNSLEQLLSENDIDSED